MSETRKQYWRSLEQLADDPAFHEFVEHEFPAKAAEPPDGISRREMMLLLGASLSFAGLSACRRPVEHIVPFATAPEDYIPGIPRYYATSMPLGTASYGVIVESHEGRPTKIEGNPAHPATRGKTSAWMQAAILDLYDPDRSQRPQRIGSDGKVTPASWDEFGAAWKTLHDGYLANGGQGLAVLGESTASPTLMRLRAEFRSTFPNAVWASWEPVGDENVRRGLGAGGTSTVPVYDLSKARVVLALDADLLGTDPSSADHTRGFADARRVASTGDDMNRLYVVEGTYTITGGMADHRLRLPASQIGRFVRALGAELGLGNPADGDVDARFVRAVARDLRANAGASLVVAGPGQPPAVHAAVAAINAALGNAGTTVRYHDAGYAEHSSDGQLAELVAAMTAGTVETLVVLGANPVYAAPADLELAGALTSVQNKIHFGERLDETGRACDWHLPRAHFLESWGDCRTAAGTASVIQPLIAPLYDSRSDTDFLALLLAGEPADNAGYEAVRATWSAVLSGEFDEAWSRLLHAGLHESSANPAAGPAAGASAVAALPVSPAPSREALELSFRVCPSMYDGRYANNGWLQELPDTVTKLTWSNAALISPATADALGLQREDVVRIAVGDRSVEAPVWIVPGQADWTVGLALGYGRSAAGRVGNGVGADAYALRTSAEPWIVGGVTLAKTGERAELASVQDHGSMREPLTGHTRPIVREATLDEYRHEPGFAAEMVEHPPLKQLFTDPQSYAQGYQWAMTIDLNVCTGCNACVVACQSENNIPVVGPEQTRAGREMQWLRVDRYFASPEGDPEQQADPEMVFQPVPCMHCENAPCEQVCPVAATTHDDEGLNTMVYNRCIGTRYCSNNCPYKVRRFNYFNFTKDMPEIMQLAQNPDVTVRSRGVIEKCTYCTQRINAAKIHARLDGREVIDGEIQTACQQACPADAIVFGNLNDPQSAIVQAKAQDRNYAMLSELNVRPRTTYLAKLRNPNPELVES